MRKGYNLPKNTVLMATDIVLLHLYIVVVANDTVLMATDTVLVDLCTV
jgi:hypothetical protein